MCTPGRGRASNSQRKSIYTTKYHSVYIMYQNRETSRRRNIDYSLVDTHAIYVTIKTWYPRQQSPLVIGPCLDPKRLSERSILAHASECKAKPFNAFVVKHLSKGLFQYIVAVQHCGNGILPLRIQHSSRVDIYIYIHIVSKGRKVRRNYIGRSS